MDEEIAEIEAMFSGQNDYLVMKGILNQMFIDDYQKEQEAHPRIGPHASEFKESFKGAWRYCFRKSILQEFYHYPGEEGMSVKRIRINKLGWYIHVMIQRLFKRSGRAVEIEISHKHPRYGVWYTPDIIAKIVEFCGDKDVVVEIKSMNKASFEKAITKFPNDAYRGHPEAYKQAHIYMFLHGLDKGMIYLFCKDNSEIHYYLIDYDPVFMQPFIDRIETRLRLKMIFESQDGRLHKKVCEDQNSVRAKSCPVRDLCFMKNSEARKPFLRVNTTEIQQNASAMYGEGA